MHPIWFSCKYGYHDELGAFFYFLWIVCEGEPLPKASAPHRISAVVRIPNEEVMAEFQMLVTEIAGIDGQDLRQMLSCLIQGDLDTFFSLYEDILKKETP